jgi:signal peptidase II
MQYALIAMIAAICLFLVVLLVRTPREDGWSRCGIALMIGGALGNLADRIIYGHVVDFIDFHIGHWHWYTFNLADAFITVGAIMMAKSIFFPSPALKGKE